MMTVSISDHRDGVVRHAGATVAASPLRRGSGRLALGGGAGSVTRYTGPGGGLLGTRGAEVESGDGAAETRAGCDGRLWGAVGVGRGNLAPTAERACTRPDDAEGPSGDARAAHSRALAGRSPRPPPRPLPRPRPKPPPRARTVRCSSGLPSSSAGSALGSACSAAAPAFTSAIASGARLVGGTALTAVVNVLRWAQLLLILAKALAATALAKSVLALESIYFGARHVLVTLLA